MDVVNLMLIGKRRNTKSSKQGLVAINPPWMLADEMEILLTFLVELFGGGRRLDWVTPND